MSLPRLSTGTWVKIALVFIALVVGAYFILRGMDLNQLHQILIAGIDWLRDAGPWVFFLAMAILPAIGAPITAFTITAGPAFGLAISIPAAAVAILINMTLNYWLARCWLRPTVEWFLRHTSFKIPRASEGNSRRLTLLVRLAPGLPYFAQGFVLGLAEVPFGIYLTISFAVQYSFAVGFMIFGDALMKGRSGLIITGGAILLIAVGVVHFLRKRFARGNTTPA